MAHSKYELSAQCEVLKGNQIERKLAVKQAQMKTDIETEWRSKSHELYPNFNTKSCKITAQMRTNSMNLEKKRFAQRQNELNKEKLSFERNKARQMAQMEHQKQVNSWDESPESIDHVRFAII
eukprot:953178_1